jgi:hypothetical protein
MSQPILRAKHAFRRKEQVLMVELSTVSSLPCTVQAALLIGRSYLKQIFVTQALVSLR